MAEQYVPTESVEENMRQIQARSRVERAGMINSIYSATGKAGRFMSQVAVLEGKSGQTTDTSLLENRNGPESPKQHMGNEDLPDNINLLVKERNQRRALGKKAKVLSYDFKVDSLSPVAILQAGSFGLIAKDNPVLTAIQAVQGKFQSDQPVSHAPGMYVPNPAKIKTLAQPDTSSLEFLQTESDFRRASASADDYLVTSSADLSKMYEDSSFSVPSPVQEDMGQEPMQDITQDGVTESMRGRESFFDDILANGKSSFEDSMGLQM